MITGNEPAMPQLTYNRKTGKADGFELGLTKREYFAARAMQGIISTGKELQMNRI